jgi:hypothetical protein
MFFCQDLRKCSYFLLSAIRPSNILTVSRLGVNSNHVCYQHHITSGSSADGRLLFMSVGIFNFFGLKNDDPEEESELITTIKRGVLLTQVCCRLLDVTVSQYSF